MMEILQDSLTLHVSVVLEEPNRDLDKTARSPAKGWALLVSDDPKIWQLYTSVKGEQYSAKWWFTSDESHGTIRKK